MDSEPGFDKDVLFTVGETEFQEKCAGVDVYGISGKMTGQSGNRRCFGGGMKRGIGVRMKERGCQGLSPVVSA
jgi:hypothetical protein